MAIQHFPPPPTRIIPKLYNLGLGPLIGCFILLLTTTGRRSGLPRVTSFQYEKIDGAYSIGLACGAQAEAVTAFDRIADFLEFRLRHHPTWSG